MNINGFKIRWINYACYEIVLPNGKVIVVDPCINFEKKEEFTPDNFTGADYIFLSHTHYDHTMDLGYLEKKYKSKVFVGSMSCLALLHYFDINFDRVYPVSPNEKFEMEDFTLEVFRSKHTFMNNEDNVMSKRRENFNGKFPTEHRYADICGSIEYMDYLITLKNNIRIFISGGGPNKYFYNNIFQTMKETAPNIVIRQSSSKYTPEEFAQTVDQFHSQLVLPLHQDGIERKTNMKIQDYVDRANVEFEKLNSSTRMLNPIKYKWYEISMNVTCLEDK